MSKSTRNHLRRIRKTMSMRIKGTIRVRTTMSTSKRTGIKRVTIRAQMITIMITKSSMTRTLIEVTIKSRSMMSLRRRVTTIKLKIIRKRVMLSTKRSPNIHSRATIREMLSMITGTSLIRMSSSLRKGARAKQVGEEAIKSTIKIENPILNMRVMLSVNVKNLFSLLYLFLESDNKNNYPQQNDK